MVGRGTDTDSRIETFAETDRRLIQEQLAAKDVKIADLKHDVSDYLEVIRMYEEVLDAKDKVSKIEKYEAFVAADDELQILLSEEDAWKLEGNHDHWAKRVDHKKNMKIKARAALEGE